MIKETKMKTLFFIFTLLFTNLTIAHEDHFLGDGILHRLFHILFVTILIAVIVKAVRYYKFKKSEKL
ncbi:hypothetical protein PP2015_3984 [Pseudoalteromonas phenolica]|uniref:Uncharacterized protein n=2 Tax=Pseudoalteromonas phenolica TaxID=161398 RepID=A0A0S2K8V3_9GAMM|nr:hypothetical protein PP2015_3984 [Pseudoalteromonas phenolica]